MSEEWIGKCLSSIQKQKIRDFICIVIDDHSRDGTFEVAQKMVRPIIKRNKMLTLNVVK